MSGECIFPDNILNKSIKNHSELKEIKEPIYQMTIESEKGRKEIIHIYPNSKPEEIAYNFCKDNNLDFETLELMINQIKNLMKTINQKKRENNKENINEQNENKLIYSNEPILEDSEEQQSLSTEKIMKKKSFQDNYLKNVEKDKEKNINNDVNNEINNDINNNKNNDIDSDIDSDIYSNNIKDINTENTNEKNDDNNTIDNNKNNNYDKIIKSNNKNNIDNSNINYLKINGDFKEKKLNNSKTSSIIMNTINNCLELIEKEEKNIVSSTSSPSSILGSSSTLNQKKSINCKENINIFNVDKDKENKNNNNNNNQHNNNKKRNIVISKSFINKVPKNITNTNIFITSRNNNNINKNNIINNQQMNVVELDPENKNLSDEHKNSSNNNKNILTKNINVHNMSNAPNSSNSYEYYSQKQKEILKNNKNFQRIINMIKKNNIRNINRQFSTENLALVKSNNSSKIPKESKKEKNININYKIKPKNNIHYGINYKRNNLNINNVNSNYIANSKEKYISDINDKDPFYSLSKNEETSTLNNIIKNSMSTHTNYATNKNSIKHEINMTIISKQKKTNTNILKKNNNLIMLKTCKNNNKKIINRNCQTLSDGDCKNNFLSQDKLFKDFKSKILLTKSSNRSKPKQINIKSKDKKKLSPSPNADYYKNDILKKKYNFMCNLNLNSPLLYRDFINDTNLKKYRNYFKSPQLKANTSQTTMKNIIIKKNKTNMYKYSFSNYNKNNKFLLNQTSRNNNLNDHSSFLKSRCNSFNDFNSNINNIFINLKYSNNKKNKYVSPCNEKCINENQQNKKKCTKKRNISQVLSSNKINCYTNNNSINNKKLSINETNDNPIINNMNLNLNITTESNNNSYSCKNKIRSSCNFCKNVKNKMNNKIPYKNNLNKKRPCYLFIKSQNSSPPSTSRNKNLKKNHSTLLQNSNLKIKLLKKNKITEALKELFYCLSNKRNQIDIFKINKNNFIIPDDIIKSVQFILKNCEKNKGSVSIKEFILKGTILFDSLPFEEQIMILNLNNNDK